MHDETLSFTLENKKIKSKRYVYYGLKRTFDIIISLTSLILLLPLFLIIGILIKLDSKGPVILRQTRIGKNGKPFKIYKFRSMVDHAEELLFKLMAEDPAINEEYTINKKLKNDPRFTKIGKFIRRTSIDELPQLLNILNGDMSLVGPRPYLPYEKEDMGLYYQDVIKVRPGLTGLWQVSGRSDCSFQHRCRLDRKYYYIKGFKTDIKIILKTFKVVFSKKGAE